MKNAWVAFWQCVLLASLTGCFGLINDPVRHYYTLHLEALSDVHAEHVPGLLRVRDLDAESAYDRFQIVVRHSPFELVYRQKDVWAVKPNRMISDILARSLMNENVFSGVTRELSERRPQYLMSGELQAIEVYDSGNTWFAHLAISLQITHFETGRIVWTYHFDERKEVPSKEFPVCVRALSELTSQASASAINSMRNIGEEKAESAADDGGSAGRLPPAADDTRKLTKEPAHNSRKSPLGEDTLPQEPVVIPEPAPH